MSNEQMTDAQALAEIDGYVPRHCRAAIEHIAARLRGEAATEQQAVAWLLPSGELFTSAQMEAQRRVYGDTFGLLAEPLYTHPQPAAVAGDAVRLLPAAWRATIDAASPINRQDLRPIRFVQDLEAALSAAPSAPAPVAGDAVAVDDAMVERLSREVYEVHCNTPIGHFPNDSHLPKWRAVVQHVIAALAQDRAAQGAAPSAPVGVEWPLSLLRAGNWREVYVGHRCMRLEVTYEHAAWERLMEQVEAALAQQPAAVDEAMVERALNAYFADQCQLVDKESKLFRAMKAALTAALATQHGDNT